MTASPRELEGSKWPGGFHPGSHQLEFPTVGVLGSILAGLELSAVLRLLVWLKNRTECLVPRMRTKNTSEMCASGRTYLKILRQFIRSGQNHIARYSERGKKARRTEEKVGRQHQAMDRPGVCQVPEGSAEQKKNGGDWL